MDKEIELKVKKLLLRFKKEVFKKEKIKVEMAKVITSYARPFKDNLLNRRFFVLLYKLIYNESLLDIFTNFLKERMAYDEFIENLTYNPIRYCTIHKLCNSTYVESYLDESFLWSNTDEGFDFWSDISQEWVDYISFSCNELDKMMRLTTVQELHIN